MRIMYLTQWFDPEPGVIKGADFVHRLEAEGHEVTVVTGIPNYPTGKIFPGYRFRLYQREQLLGCDVRRLALYPSHSRSSAGRALNFLSFFLSALLYGLFRVGRYDLVYVYHPPITVGLAAALFGWARRRRFILEIQDLWPDTVVSSGMNGTGRMGALLTALCNFTYRRAAMIILQSHGMKRLLIERGVPAEKLATVRNWSDAAALETPPLPDRKAVGFSDRFTFLYAGNLGRAQELDAVIRAAKLAADRGAELDLALIGDGIDADALRALAAEIGADNVRFLPRVPKSEIRRIMAAADALVIHLADEPHLAFTIPSKTQFYLASGQPILAGISGEAAEILIESGAALVTPPADVQKLAEAMERMARWSADELRRAGEAGRAYYLRELEFEHGMRATLDVIERARVIPAFQ